MTSRKRGRPITHKKRRPYPFPGQWNTPEGIELLLESVKPKDVNDEASQAS